MFSLNCVSGSVGVSGNGVCIRRWCVESQFLMPLMESDFWCHYQKYQEHFLMHKIRRIDGRRGFQTSGNMFELARTNFTIKKLNSDEIPGWKGPESEQPRNSSKFRLDFLIKKTATLWLLEGIMVTKPALRIWYSQCVLRVDTLSARKYFGSQYCHPFYPPNLVSSRSSRATPIATITTSILRHNNGEADVPFHDGVVPWMRPVPQLLLANHKPVDYVGGNGTIFGFWVTLCAPNHVDYTCSNMTWSGPYWRKLRNSYIVLPKARNHLKAKNLWMDSPNPQLCDWLAPWYCPMPTASEDIFYDIITKLMMAFG